MPLPSAGGTRRRCGPARSRSRSAGFGAPGHRQGHQVRLKAATVLTGAAHQPGFQRSLHQYHHRTSLALKNGDFHAARPDDAGGLVAGTADRHELDRDLVGAQIPGAAQPRQRRGQVDGDRGAARGRRLRLVATVAVLRTMIAVTGAKEAQARHVMRGQRSVQLGRAPSRLTNTRTRVLGSVGASQSRSTAQTHCR